MKWTDLVPGDLFTVHHGHLMRFVIAITKTHVIYAYSDVYGVMSLGVREINDYNRNERMIVVI